MAEENSSQKSLLQSFTREDAKLFIVTTVATVIANVITVIVVALALLLARSQPYPVTSTNYLVLIVLTVSFAAAAPGGYFMIVAIWKPKDVSERMLKWFLLIIFSGVALAVIVFILTWIGIAEGIH
jgi:hypothetical protein